MLNKILLPLVLFVFVNIGLTANQYFLEFDGDDSYYINDNNDLLDVNDDNAWTMECWIYPFQVPASGTYPCILDRKYSFSFYIRNTNGNCGLGIVALSGSGSGFDIEGTLTSGTNYMTINEWHHVAASFDGTTTRLFIDGTIVGTSTDPDFDLDASIAAINVAARYSSGTYSRYFNGAIDEIHYSNVARYTSNFTITKTSPQQSADANTIFLHHLDEGSGTTISDEAGNFDTSLRSAPNDAEWRSWDYYSDDLSLPVQLNSFTAYYEQNVVRLHWQTASEIKNLGFIILRSLANTGPYSEIASYQSIPALRGAGNSSQAHSYAYADYQVFPNTRYWYKLVSVDINGTRTEYPPISIKTTPDANDNIDQLSNTIPKKYRLYQNYPNPFNPETKIEFDVPKTQNDNESINITIYDLMGKQIKTLFDGTLNAGHYSLKWEGTDDQGHKLNSGMYFLIFKSNNYTNTIKMILLR